jgi:hypothetical protein
MVLNSHKLILKAVLGGLVLASAVPADAGCHSRSSGHSYGSSHSSHQVYSRPIHSVPVYQPHVHSQPVYQQPVYQQPVYSQPTYPQPTYPQSQPVYSQAQPQYGSAPPTVTVSSQQSYPINGQPPQAGSMPGNSGAFPGGPVSGAPVSGSAFPVSAPAPAQNQIPGMQPPANAAYGNSAPINSAPVNAAPVNPAIIDVQQSALQALGGFAPPDAVAAQAATDSQSAPQMSLAGVWTAQLANGSRVQLSLQADGNFSWTAVNKDGQSSVFQGTYAMQNGSMSLTRGNDGQKLDGTLTLTSANTFSFQLTAAQSASLDFVRG